MCDKHPPFDYQSAGDRAFSLSKHAQAMATAQRLSAHDGLRRRVVIHRGPVFWHGVWFVQVIQRPTRPLRRSDFIMAASR